MNDWVSGEDTVPHLENVVGHSKVVGPRRAQLFAAYSCRPPKLTAQTDSSDLDLNCGAETSTNRTNMK